MFNLLGEGGTNVGSIIMLAVLLAILILYVFFGMKNRRKSQEEAMKMLSELKVGDKVVTNAGIYGTVVAMKETNMGKVVTIATGEEKKESYITINASVILGIDTKEDLILDENGNVIEDKEALKEEVLKEKATAETEETVEKPKRKTTSKKVKAE